MDKPISDKDMKLAADLVPLMIDIINGTKLFAESAVTKNHKMTIYHAIKLQQTLSNYLERIGRDAIQDDLN